ncbi:MAG: EamA family transporter, partial [Alicyclobacillaceae bacterium]|nr:EamA family transporter [Alicyclobacillaceae bacterium]
SKGWTSYGFAALSGVIGTLFGRMAVYAAIRRLGATRGIVLESAEILVTLVLAATLLHETLRPSDAAGVALLAAGITALIWERRMLHERHLWDNGVAFGVAGAILQGTGHFVRKWGMVQTTLPVVSAAVDLWAALLVYVVLLVSTGRLRTCTRAVFSQPNPYLLAAGITSAAGVLLFFHAVQAVPVSVVAVTLGFEPLLVAAVSKLLFRDLEHITWLTWVYSAVVAAGIGIVQAR